MISIVSIIHEAFDSTIPSEQELRSAAESQRGIPETTMLEVTSQLHKAGGSAVFTDALEHIGDLAHRLQEPNNIGMGGAAEKIRKLNRLMFPREGWMNLEQEMEHALQGNAEFIVKERYPNYGDGYEAYEKVRQNHQDEIEEVKQSIQQAMSQYLPAYVKAHAEHNLPITYAGVLGKQAAMQLGSLDFDGLRQTTRRLTQFFDEYVGTPEIYRRA